MSKKIVVIGGGASGLFFAVSLKKMNPGLDICIVEKEAKLGKKLSATGGGKCNIAPAAEEKDVPLGYNRVKEVRELFERYPFEEYRKLLRLCGVEIKRIKDYGYYPVHENAPQLVKTLTDQIDKLGIEVIHDEYLSYEEKDDGVLVKLKEQTLKADFLVIATGGKMNKETLPGLCPIKVREDISSLLGVRMEADVALYYKGELIRKESGELMFKEDALSGICIMNLASYISRRYMQYGYKDIKEYEIHVDFLKGEKYLPTIDDTVYSYYLSLIKDKMGQYIMNKFHLPKDDLASQYTSTLNISLTDLIFHVQDLYDYSIAHVSVGGEEQLKSEKVQYIGEVLDFDGLCGGYNLRLFITQAFDLANKLAKKQL